MALPVGLLGLILLAACGGPSPTQDSVLGFPPTPVGVVSVPTYEELGDATCEEGRRLQRARLRGDPNADPTVWVEKSYGRRYTVLWPRGAYATFEPDLVLYSVLGSVIGREGSMLDLSGGTLPGSDLLAVCEVRTTEF